MLDLHGWYTLAVVGVMFVALYREAIGADFVIFTALVALWVPGIISTEEALSGFHNPMVIAIGLLFIISAALQHTGAVSLIADRLLPQNASSRRSLFRMKLSVSAISGFVNNTPIVALLTPTIRDWAVRRKVSPSKYLIPLSYAAVLGGTFTLLGTATNLVASGIISEAGHAPLGMFELTPVGVPMGIAGVLLITILAPRLLPDRRTPDMQTGKAEREYAVVLEVAEDCPLIGKTVEGAGLRQLSGLFLAEIQRGNRRLVPVRPYMELQRGDRLVLFGLVETVVELRKTKGLIPVTQVDEDGVLPGDVNLFEVVISGNSPLVGQNLRDAGFRRRYDAAVIAIHRGGERVQGKLGDVVLRAGDTLMVEAAPGFRRTWANSRHFYLVSAVDASERPRHRLAKVAMVALTAMIVLVATGVLPIVQAAALAAIALIGVGAVRADEARNAINLSVLIVIASAFGLSHAIGNSGLAEFFAVWVADLAEGSAPWVALAVIWIATVVATELLSNAAAAAIVIPIALSTAEALERDPRPFAIAVTLAASMSFITPVGNQTHLIVYGPGGYRFGDFARMGIPLSILMFAVAMFLIPIFWGWG